MSLDDKTIMNLARQLGVKADQKSAAQITKGYENKSDESLVAEIEGIRDKLAANNVSYEKQREIIQSLMPMMNGQQKARLKELIRLIDK